MHVSRRNFIRNISWGAGGIALAGSFGFVSAPSLTGKSVKAIVVDFSKCAGCRTCETVCSSSNHKTSLNGKMIPGQGNPSLSNIKVWRYHPPADVPVTCFLCKDAPCVEACPVQKDPETGRKALYVSEDFGTIKNDYNRCIGCGNCSEACKAERGGVIFPDEDGTPHGMCTLCEGDPQCIQWCPFEALSYLEITADMQYREMSPDRIAWSLFGEFYDEATKKQFEL